MDQAKEDMLMDLAEFRALTHLSPSCERRHRRGQHDWPPHLEIGRKIFYRRASVVQWLEHREATQGTVR